MGSGQGQFQLNRRKPFAAQFVKSQSPFQESRRKSGARQTDHIDQIAFGQTERLTG